MARESTGIGSATLPVHFIGPDTVRHIFKRHGVGDSNSSQIPLEVNDFGLIPEIVKHPDEVVEIEKKNGKRRFRYKKRFNGITFYIEEVRQKAKFLAGVTMWKVKSGALRATPEGGVAQTSDNAPQTTSPDISLSDSPPENKDILYAVNRRPLKNSNGWDIVDNPADADNFWRWFGNSKAVNAQGEPLVLFHQTSKENATGIYNNGGFDVSRMRARATDEQVPDGIFFKPTRDDIGVGAARREDIEQIPVYLSLQNPLIVENRDELQRFGEEDDAFKRLTAEYRRRDREVAQKYDAMEAEVKALPKDKINEAYAPFGSTKTNKLVFLPPP